MSPVNGEVSNTPMVWARPEKLAQTLASHIRKQLIAGDLANGYVFPAEPVLIEQYKVSRTTLREAFRILEAQSLVTIQRGAKGGARATIPDILVAARQLGMHLQLQGATLTSVYETRSALEVPMARKLATIKDPRHIDHLRDALAKERQALGDNHQFRDASTSFHKLIGDLSGNATSQIVANMLGDMVNLHAQQVVHESVPNEEAAVHRAHAKLLMLVEKGDAAAAETHWRRHLDAVSGHMTAHASPDEVINLFH
jgi:DNA-binding FadR family transcriptional regulator